MMKKTKVLMLVVVLIMASFTLTGCFFGSSGSSNNPAEADYYELDLEIRGQGKVNNLEEGIHEFQEDAVVDLEALPAEGWEFKEWIGSVSETSRKETSIFMDGNKQLVAVFEETNNGGTDNYSLNLSLTQVSSEELTYEITGSSDPEAYFFDFYVDGEFVGGNGSPEYTSSSQSIEHTFDSSKAGEEVEIRLDILNLDNEVLDSRTKTFTLEQLDDPNPQPAYFNVLINSTNSPIVEGNTLQVDVTVENTGEQADTQDIDLLIDGILQDSESISLSESSSTTLTLTWSSAVGEDGDYTVKVRSNDDSDTEAVTVNKEDSTNSEVSFTYNRLESLRYEFTATEPDGARFWEWKFPDENYWQGYDGKNTITHTFNSSGEKRVQLRILNDSEEIIGSYEETIDVD